MGPPAPDAGAVSEPGRGATLATSAAAILAIAGGIGMCFLVLYAIVYLPLHDGVSLNFGEPLRFGDLLALGSGAVAVAVGALILKRRPGRPVVTGVVLILAGAPTLILALLWAFPETFNLSFYPQPFYFGYTYLSTLGLTHVAGGYVQVPLLGASATVIASGALMAAAGKKAARGEAT
ncbi:MAG: hypothetical protein WBM00_08675 [Solirubrobacterales bacterium]